MGMNVENIFIQIDEKDKIVSLLPNVRLEDKWKMAVANPQDGWVHLLDSHGDATSEIAEKLSQILLTKTICIQIYETSGDAGWYVFDKGKLIQSKEAVASRDPYGEIVKFLRKNNINQKPLLFQEIIKSADWIKVQRK